MMRDRDRERSFFVLIFIDGINVVSIVQFFFFYNGDNIVNFIQPILRYLLYCIKVK